MVHVFEDGGWIVVRLFCDEIEPRSGLPYKRIFMYEVDPQAENKITRVPKDEVRGMTDKFESTAGDNTGCLIFE